MIIFGGYLEVKSNFLITQTEKDTDYSNNKYFGSHKF